MIQMTVPIVSFCPPSPKSKNSGVCLDPELGALLVACCVVCACKFEVGCARCGETT